MNEKQMKQKNDIMDLKRQQHKKSIKRMLGGIFAFTVLFWSNVNVVFAAEIAKNITTEVTDIVFYLGLCALVVVVAKFVAKSAWVQAGCSIVFGGVLLFFVKNPTKMSDLGELLGNKFGL